MAAGPDVFTVGETAEALHLAGQGWADFGFGALFQEEETTWAAMPRSAAQTPFKSESTRVKSCQCVAVMIAVAAWAKRVTNPAGK